MTKIFLWRVRLNRIPVQPCNSKTGPWLHSKSTALVLRLYQRHALKAFRASVGDLPPEIGPEFMLGFGVKTLDI